MQHASSPHRDCAFGPPHGIDCPNPAAAGYEYCHYHLGPPTPENARDWVFAFICYEVGEDPVYVSEQSRLIDDLGADSIDAVEIIMLLEENLSVQISDEESEGLQSVGDFVNCVTKYVGKASAVTLPTAPSIDIEARNDKYAERILNRTIQSEMFRSYYEALELDEEEVVRLFRQVMGNRFIYNVTPAVVYKDEEKQEPECVHLFLLGRHNLFYFKLLNRSVKFEWSALKDLRLTYEVSLDDNKKISMISVTSSLAVDPHDANRHDTDSPEAMCDSEVNLHNVSFDFVGKEIEGALKFLDKYLTNLEGENG
jgi:acyl carrier protein